MDKKVSEHADALFILKLKELSKKEIEERTAIHADANRRGLSDSGISQGNLLKSNVSSIGRRTQARLHSFQEAFEAAKIEPSPEDLKIIWQNTESVHTQGVAMTYANMKRRSTVIGRPNDHVPNVQAAAAHGHDEVLAEYNVWRSRVGLAGVKQAFATASIPALNELKDKVACAADLHSLLDSNKQGRVAVLYIDLDNFKSVNTAKGHDGGDKCIEHAASIIGSVVQHKGRVYRLHGTGDEFAVILPNYDESEARVTGERIRRTVEEQKPGGDISVTTSIGVFIATGKITAEDALTQADQAMYEAKKTKNTIHFA
jgi:diguanylate cyclase (GGDEF)-like protein